MFSTTSQGWAAKSLSSGWLRGDSQRTADVSVPSLVPPRLSNTAPSISRRNNTTSPPSSAPLGLSSSSSHSSRLILPKSSSTKSSKASAPLASPIPPFLLESITAQPGARKSPKFTYNNLRPLVKAEERIIFWSSSFHRLACLSTAALPEALLFKSELAVVWSLEKDTRASYGAGIMRFHQFCDAFDISEDARVPASPDLLSAFLASSAWGQVSEKTARSWLSGLRAWHVRQRAPWKGDDLSVSMILTSVRKHKPASSTRPPRPPVTVKHLLTLKASLNLDNTFDIAVWAAAVVTFWSCSRLGETLVVSASKFDPKYHVSQSAVVDFKHTEESNLLYAAFDIPWSKTTMFDGAKIIVSERADDPLCPVAALRRHLLFNTNASSPMPLFAFRVGLDPPKWEPLSKSLFMDRCNRAWSAGGLERVSGHSFRIGGATEYLMQGVAPAIVQRIGRWESDAFMVYWRKLETIIPTFLAMSNSDPRFHKLVATLEASRSAGRR